MAISNSGSVGRGRETLGTDDVRINKLTRLLCFVMKNVETDNWYRDMVLDSAFERKTSQDAEDLMNFWEQHRLDNE